MKTLIFMVKSSRNIFAVLCAQSWLSYMSHFKTSMSGDGYWGYPVYESRFTQDYAFKC